MTPWIRFGDGLRAGHLELDALHGASSQSERRGAVHHAPLTRNSSAASVRSTRRATLVCSSRWSRSHNMRDDAYLPSWPENGDVLTPKVIRTVGSSTFIRSSGSGASGDATVSPIRTSLKPESATISPADADSISWRARSRNVKRRSHLVGRGVVVVVD